MLSAGETAAEAPGDIARSLGAGDASGIAHGLGEGDSAATREDLLTWVASVRAEDAVDVGASPAGDSGGDVSSVTGIGTGGGAGSSKAPHGSSSSGVSPQLIVTALGPLDPAGALSNVSACDMPN